MNQLQAIAEHLATSVDFWIGVGLLLMFLGLCSVVSRVRKAMVKPPKPDVALVFDRVEIPPLASIWRRDGQVRTVLDSELRREYPYTQGVEYQTPGYRKTRISFAEWGEWVSGAERIA